MESDTEIFASMNFLWKKQGMYLRMAEAKNTVSQGRRGRSWEIVYAGKHYARKKICGMQLSGKRGGSRCVAVVIESTQTIVEDEKGHSWISRRPTRERVGIKDGPEGLSEIVHSGDLTGCSEQQRIGTGCQLQNIYESWHLGKEGKVSISCTDSDEWHPCYG